MSVIRYINNLHYSVRIILAVFSLVFALGNIYIALVPELSYQIWIVVFYTAILMQALSLCVIKSICYSSKFIIHFTKYNEYIFYALIFLSITIEFELVVAVACLWLLGIVKLMMNE